MRLSNFSFKKNPISTIFGLLVIVAGLLPFVLPGRISLSEAVEVGEGLKAVEVLIVQFVAEAAGLVSLFGKDLAGIPDAE
ncbi:hypothetical protein LCGC14_0278140 [marine sediment metagenome]|uniref:Uncharacterized protein n=1 Tax=marine sediment metagenome TaxID=412755 RepID=A0A0F9WHS9_9ZZZZ